MTTTQRVDVERLSESIRMIEGCRVFVTTREKIKHPEGTDLFDESVRIIADALPALLHQLAELQERNEYLASELQLARSHVSGWKVRCNQWQEQAEAAERARDESMGLLREVINNPHADGDALLDSKIAAFLAASGGDKT